MHKVGSKIQRHEFNKTELEKSRRVRQCLRSHSVSPCAMNGVMCVHEYLFGTLNVHVVSIASFNENIESKLPPSKALFVPILRYFRINLHFKWCFFNLEL